MLIRTGIMLLANAVGLIVGVRSGAARASALKGLAVGGLGPLAYEMWGLYSYLVRFDPATPWTPPGGYAPLYTVYELSVPGRIERTHAQVAEAWRNDERLGSWLGGAFVVLGAVLITRARAARR